MSPPSQGYESTRMVPECYSASQTSQHSSSHRLPNTHNNPSTQLSSTQPAQPKRMDPLPSLPHSPSGCPSPSRAPVQLVQNLHVGTLRTRSCEKSWTQAKASQTCRPQFMDGLHQQSLQPIIPWLHFNSSSSFPKPRHT
jgi:hypothetical protein